MHAQNVMDSRTLRPGAGLYQADLRSIICLARGRRLIRANISIKTNLWPQQSQSLSLWLHVLHRASQKSLLPCLTNLQGDPVDAYKLMTGEEAIPSKIWFICDLFVFRPVLFLWVEFLDNWPLVASSTRVEVLSRLWSRGQRDHFKKMG